MTLDSKPHPDAKDIAALAYELWERRGRPDGSSEVDWLRAEELLAAELQRSSFAPAESAPAAAAPVRAQVPETARGVRRNPRPR